MNKSQIPKLGMFGALEVADDPTSTWLKVRNRQSRKDIDSRSRTHNIQWAYVRRYTGEAIPCFLI